MGKLPIPSQFKVSAPSAGRLPLGRGETDMEARSPRDFPTSGGRLSRRLHALAASASVPAGVGVQ